MPKKAKEKVYMKNSLKKSAIIAMVLGMLFGGLLAAPVEAGVGTMTAQAANASINIRLEVPSRHATNTFNATPIVVRLASSNYNSIRSRIEYNNVSVNSQVRRLII